MRPLYLAGILDPQRNNFALLRLCAALAVLASHALFLQSGDPHREILSGQTFYNLGQHAVNVFFTMSGIMVSASLARSRSLLDFAVARALRLFPAMIVCALIIALVVGPMVSALPLSSYLSDVAVLRFLALTIPAVSGTAGLPGVFDGNPFPSVVDGPVWTIKYEILCYIVLAAFGASGWLASRRHFAPLIGVSWLLAAFVLFADFGHIDSKADHLARFWLCFSFGMALYQLRERVPVSVFAVAGLALLWWATLGTAAERIVSLLATGYGAVWLASLPIGMVRRATNEVDLSYGIYIFGWPVTQTLVGFDPFLPTLSLEMAAATITMALALLSWVLVEKPAMARRHAIVAWLRTAWRRPQPAALPH